MQSNLRITGGKWRGRLVTFHKGKIRPTTSIMRERLFNWLGNLQGKKCLDLFAGSGCLGFEAASRGASLVTFAELAIETLQNLRLEGKKLGGSFEYYLTHIPKRIKRIPIQKYDLIFLDPPFGFNLLEETCIKLTPYLKTGSLVYLESETPLNIVFYPNTWQLRHQYCGSSYSAQLLEVVE